MSIEYDPNRTAFIALLNYIDGEKRYILLLLRDSKSKTIEVVSGPGSAPLKSAIRFHPEIPLGANIQSIELHPQQGCTRA